MKTLVPCVLVLLWASVAAAQGTVPCGAGPTAGPTRPPMAVLGVGVLKFDLCGLTDAGMAIRTHQVFVGAATVPVVFPASICGAWEPAPDNVPPPALPLKNYTCKAPLPALPLTASPADIAVQTVMTYLDAKIESEKVLLPFAPFKEVPSANQSPGRFRVEPK